MLKIIAKLFRLSLIKLSLTKCCITSFT